MKLVTFNTLDALRAAAPAWDDLWRRSECAWPTMRAETLAHWLERFAAGKRYAILGVESDDQLVAALPLFGDRIAKILPVGRLPGNDLCSVGDLLVDESRIDEAMPVLVSGIRRQRWPLIWCDAIFPQTRRWKAFLAAAEQAGMSYSRRHRGMTGLVDIGDDWQSYFARRSRNHRRQMRVVTARAEKEGALELYLYSEPLGDSLPAFLKRGFEIEDKSWKGSAGTSVLRIPGAFDFFQEQAAIVAASGHLMLAFLELNGRPIAFEYGWLAKGVYNSLKVGYDAAYERLSPGQLLRSRMIEQFHQDRSAALIDYLGPLCDATAKWTTRSYPVERLVLANGVMGRLLLRGYKARQRPDVSSEIDAIPSSTPTHLHEVEELEPVIV